MNARQRRFCEEYAAYPVAAEAARRAGYSERTARQVGQRLLTNADISGYIKQLQDEATAARIATSEDVKSFWSEVMNNKGEKTAVRLKASELLAKAAGMFLPDKSEGEGEPFDDVVIYMPKLVAGRPVGVKDKWLRRVFGVLDPNAPSCCVVDKPG